MRHWMTRIGKKLLVTALPLLLSPVISSDGGTRMALHAYDGPTLEKFENAGHGISFLKPRGWNVAFESDKITLVSGGGTAERVLLWPLVGLKPQVRAIHLLRFLYEASKQQHPELRIEERNMNREQTFVRLVASFVEGGKGKRGLYLVSLKGGVGLVAGYETDAAAFSSAGGLLEKIAGSFTLEEKTWKTACKAGSEVGSMPAATPTIDPQSLQVRSSPDNTVFVLVPPDWTVGGGNFVVIATSKDENMGVFATNDHQPGMSGPEAYFSTKLMPFFRCSQVNIEKKEPNRDFENMLRAQGLSAEAMNFFGDTLNGDGKHVKFAILVYRVAMPTPSGGFVSTLGTFGIPEEFDRNKNILIAMALSILPNQSEVMGRFKQNLAGLAAASRTISSTNDVVIAGLRSASANWDRAMDKYNYYLSGEQVKYSSLDNRIYRFDSALGETISNPNYPGEILTDVPDALWNELPHELPR